MGRERRGMVFFFFFAAALFFFLAVGSSAGFSDFTNMSQILGGNPMMMGNWDDAQVSGVWRDFESLLDAHKGQQNCTNLPLLKKYLQQFGYQAWPDDGSGLESPDFDNQTETAIKLYQKNFGLNETGVLDEPTLKQMMKPRCGREDMLNGISLMGRNSDSNSSSSRFLHHHQHHRGGVKHYSFFPNSPKWESKSVLTYSIASSSSSLTGIPNSDLQKVFADAFDQWAAAVPINFTLVPDSQSADIKIAFANGEHGDGKPFDGVLGVLAHAFSPEDGRLHFDAAESWSVNLKSDSSRTAVDLKSVAVHEIGHILGLGHSADESAVMFPNIGAREQKLVLTSDDVNGAQALYGVNPSYDPNLHSESRSQPEKGIASGATATAHTIVSGWTMRFVFFILLLLLL